LRRPLMVNFTRSMNQTILIKKPPHFSFKECLWFLDRDLDDCMHKVFENSVRKLVSFNNSEVLMEVSEQGKHISIELLVGSVEDDNLVKDYMEEWFDLSRNIKPFYELLEQDKELSVLRKKYRGLRIIGIPDFFEVLCWCVIGQQINLDFAYKIKRKLVERYGKHVTYKGEKYYLFPQPADILPLSVEELKALQMTGKKAEYILGIARLYAEGKLSALKIKKLKNENLMLAELVKVRGIGEWTANYAIMKGLRAMNGIPYGDSGVNNALFQLKGIAKRNNRKEVDKVFDRFKGWKTYLVFYLWRSLRNQGQ
jgi:DNA-3-methyladenine glycosylase II